MTLPKDSIWPGAVDSRFATLTTARASYHSATELTGHTLHYHRIFEIRELSVPVEKARDLREFYRAIDGDERGAAVLKRVRA